MIEDDNAQLRRRPVIRVFVSSTFTDLKHERDALQRDVFPKLEQLCASRQFQFHAIDLRWGVPTEASLDHRTMQICFEELRRSQEISPQPNFLILLGNRYGWRPLPEEVSEDEFRALEEAALSEPARNILRDWYRRDENAVPPVYVLQSRKQDLSDGRDYTNDQVWNEVQRVLWDVINHAYPADQLAGRFDNPTALDVPLPAIVRFQASATEQEIWRGALGVPNASEHVLAFVREIENIEAFQRPVDIRDFVDVDESGAIDAVSQDALRQLKEQIRKRLGEGNVIGIEHARLTRSTNEKGEPSIDVTARHLEELCARVRAALEAIIHRQINEYWGTSGSDIPSARELELERLEHQRFGQERAPAGSFVGRERHLQAIKSYLLSDSHAPLVVHGASGCGKTALLAKAAFDFSQSAVRNPQSAIVTRFIGVTPRSSDIRSLLASLCQELKQRHPLEAPLPGDVHELTRELQEHFKAAAAHEPLVLFLDALDQLADAENGRSLFWIPFGPLPSHVKLIVSCLSDRAPEDPVGRPYAALKRRGLAEEDFINLDALSEGEAQTLLFERNYPGPPLRSGESGGGRFLLAICARLRVMQKDLLWQGRRISEAELGWVRDWIAAHPDWSRKRLARELCQEWNWHTATGQRRDFTARNFLLKLERERRTERKRSAYTPSMRSYTRNVRFQPVPLRTLEARGCFQYGLSRTEVRMSRVEELKAEIEQLPAEELGELFRWLSEKDWERWDRQIEADSQAGRLDFLIREARDEKAKGKLRDL